MIRYILAALILGVLTWSSLDQKGPVNDVTPAPTEVIGERGKDELWRQQRQAWIEHMHRSSPDQNWRSIDARTRQHLTESRLQYQANRQQVGAATKGTVVLASGVHGRWHERGSANLAGRTRETLYVADSDELFVYSDGGNTWHADYTALNWQSLHDQLRLAGGDLGRFDGTNERLVIASTNPKGIYTSDDRGDTWSSAPVLLDNVFGLRSMAIPNSQSNHLLAAYQHWHWIGAWVQATTLVTSSDRGETLQVLGQIGEYQNGGAASVFSPVDFDTQAYLLYESDVSTVDIQNGTTTQIGTVPISFTTNSITHAVLSGGVDSSGNTFLFAAYNVGGSTHVYRSLDGGVNWSFRGTAPTYLFGSNSFGSSSRDPNQVALGGINAYYSLNGGSSWILINNWVDYYGNEATRLHADIVNISYFVDNTSNERLFIDTDGGSYVSFNGGATVSNLSLDGLGVSQYYSSLTQRSPPYAIFAGAQDQGFQKAELPPASGLVQFRQSISGDYGHLVSSDGGFSVWTVYPSFAMRYPDAANSDQRYSWDYSSGGLGGQLWLAPLLADPNDPAAVFLAGGRLSGSGHHIIRLQNSGDQISASQNSFNFGSAITAMGISPLDSQRRYVVTDGQAFFVSSDGGATWQQQLGFTAPDNHFFYGATILPSNTDINRVWVAGSGYSGPGVFVSHDGGNTFDSFATGLPATLVHDIAISENDEWMFAATEVGAFFYDRSSNQWVDAIRDAGPDQLFWDVDYIEPLQTARFSTYGRGLWDLSVEAVRTNSSKQR